MARLTQEFHERLAGKKHDHKLLPIELGHPVTVTRADVPADVTTENVAIVEVARSRFSSLAGNDFPLGDWVAALEVVTARHGDCFDFVVFFTDPRLPQIPYSGYHRGIYNEVQGINRPAFNIRSNWGSDRLQSQVWMGRFSLGTLLQEFGHRWGSYVRYRRTRTATRRTDLMLAGGGHWAREFDDGNSPMDYDEERHVRQTAPANTWLREPVGGFEFRYCNLDLYLMGLMRRQEVGRFTLIRTYTEVGTRPGGRMLIRGTPLDLLVRNVVWAEGRRVPNEPSSQKIFGAAFVVVTRDTIGLDDLFVKKVEVLRQQLERYFQVATHNRACMATQLCCGKTISRSGLARMKLRANRITRTRQIYHGLGPIPVKVEVGIETSAGDRPIVSWSREVTPDNTTGVLHLEAQVNRGPYDGRFEIVAQSKGSDINAEMRWSASTIS